MKRTPKNQLQLYKTIITTYLKQHRIDFVEMDSAYGSYYIKVNMGNAHPCFRLSNHLIPNDSSRPTTLLYTEGLTRSKADITKRVIRTIETTLKKSTVGITISLINSLSM